MNRNLERSSAKKGLDIPRWRIALYCVNFLFCLGLSTCFLPGYASDNSDLIAAIVKGDIPTAEKLAAKGVGAKMSAKSAKSPKTAIRYAAYYGRPSVVRLLLENGAEADVPDNESGLTPLNLAILRIISEVTHCTSVMVIEPIKKIDFSAESRQRSFEIVKMLLEKGARPSWGTGPETIPGTNLGCVGWSSPYMLARYYGLDDIARLLYDNGAQRIDPGTAVIGWRRFLKVSINGKDVPGGYAFLSPHPHNIQASYSYSIEGRYTKTTTTAEPINFVINPKESHLYVIETSSKDKKWSVWIKDVGLYYPWDAANPEKYRPEKPSSE